MLKTDLEDLKQFIFATVSQSEARMMAHTNKKIDSLRNEMLEGFQGVADAFDALHNASIK